jgi:uncharacterized membrane protein
MKKIGDWISENPWKAFGAAVGCFLGFLILAIGLLNTFLIFLLATIGYIIGKMKDENHSIIDRIKDIFDRFRNR